MPGSGSPQSYTGRFAPSPTGPLHFGSIVAALASFLDARAHNGKWLLRIDDLDTVRVQNGADVKILSALETLGLHWDDEVIYQSMRQQAYKEAEELLETAGLLYACFCSRKLVGGKPYPGHCRQVKVDRLGQHAIRIRTVPSACTFDDLVQGKYSQNLYEEVGDFIVKRADNLYAYHLATVVDDAFQNISHVIRGADLLASTPRQIYLQEKLALPSPVYGHFPVALTGSGVKISKRNKAEEVMLKQRPALLLFYCLKFLGQKPEKELAVASIEDLLQWAIKNWSRSAIGKIAGRDAPPVMSIPNR